MSNQISILHPEMRGVMHISGYRGLGKTMLAIQADAPYNLAFFDFEEKAKSYHNQAQFGYYKSIVTEAAKRGTGMIPVFQLFCQEIESLPADRFTVAILDNVSPLETAMNAVVGKNAQKYADEYGSNVKNIIRGTMGGTKAVVNEMVASWLCPALYAKGIQLIVMTTHVKNKWSGGGPVPNKFYIKGADRWEDLSILTLALIPGDYRPVPAALVVKEQLGAIYWDNDLQNYRTIRRLPRRLPKATFNEIKKYLENPADLNNPEDGEVPTYAEYDPFDEKLSQDQLTIMRLSLEARMHEEGEFDKSDTVGGTTEPSGLLVAKDDRRERALSMAQEDATPQEIAAAVGVPLPVVKKWLREDE